MNVQHQISRAVSQDYRFSLFFQHGIDHIGTHHIATGKSSFRLPAINTNKCFAEMHLLDALACQDANHTFAFFLIHATEQNHFTRRVFQQMRDVAADRDDSDIFFCSPKSGRVGHCLPFSIKRWFRPVEPATRQTRRVHASAYSCSSYGFRRHHYQVKQQSHVHGGGNSVFGCAEITANGNLQKLSGFARSVYMWLT